MKTKVWLLLGVEVAALCGFVSYVLYSVKNQVDPFVGTLILVALGYIAVLCRLLRH
jgi:hypothetical protein